MIMFRTILFAFSLLFLCRNAAAQFELSSKAGVSDININGGGGGNNVSLFIDSRYSVNKRFRVGVDMSLRRRVNSNERAIGFTPDVYLLGVGSEYFLNNDKLQFFMGLSVGTHTYRHYTLDQIINQDKSNYKRVWKYHINPRMGLRFNMSEKFSFISETGLLGVFHYKLERFPSIDLTNWDYISLGCSYRF